MISIQLIPFETILYVWQEYLWPGRISKIEKNSAIEYYSLPYTYNLKYMAVDSTFFGLFDGEKLIGVNSGHPTLTGFRSRGLYVFKEYRGYNYGSMILDATVQYAKDNKFDNVWSIPRQSSFQSYAKSGFIRTSDWFTSETSEYNAYAINNIK